MKLKLFKVASQSLKLTQASTGFLSPFGEDSVSIGMC